MKPTTSTKKESYMESISSMYDYFCCNHSVFEKKIEEIMLYIDTNRRLGYNSRTLPKTSEVISFPIMTGGHNRVKRLDNFFQEIPFLDRSKFSRIIDWFKQYFSPEHGIDAFIRNFINHLEHSNLGHREDVIESFKDVYINNFSLNLFTTVLFTHFLFNGNNGTRMYANGNILEYVDSFRGCSVSYFSGKIYTTYRRTFTYSDKKENFSSTSFEITLPFVYDNDSCCIFLEIPLEDIYRKLAYSSKFVHSRFMKLNRMGIFSPVYKSDNESKEVKKNIKKSNITDEKMNVIYAHLKDFIIGGITKKCTIED